MIENVFTKDIRGLPLDIEMCVKEGMASDYFLGQDNPSLSAMDFLSEMNFFDKVVSYVDPASNVGSFYRAAKRISG